MAKTADLIERKSEKSTVAATVYFCIAAIVAIFFLEEKSVIIGLTAGLLSDSAAALVGVGIGSHASSHGKTWEGTIAGFFVAVLVPFILKANFATVLGVGLVFLVLDLFELGIDDNFTAPLLMVIVAYVFGAFL
jgi:dolichol kinase